MPSSPADVAGAMSLSDEEQTVVDGPKSVSGTPRVVAFNAEVHDEVERLAPGTVAGHWIIDAELSVGGGGEVYLAHHAQLQRKVAVKVLLKALANHPVTVQRFIQEAVAVNQIRHPSIIDVFEFGSLPDGRPYLVMELLEGETLQQLIRRQGRLDPEEAIEILAPLCDALDAAHRAGFVHRDVKAANVHLGTDRDGHRRVTLLDFGIAKALRPDSPGAGMTTRGTRLGSVTSMAPEQVLGSKISARTDVYALGALLFRMLAGRHVFDSQSVPQLERMHVESLVPNVSEVAPVSRTWNTVIKTAMAKEPSERYSGALEFMMAVKVSRRAPSRVSLPAKAGTLAIGILVRIVPASGNNQDALTATLDTIDRAEEALHDSKFDHMRVMGSTMLAAQSLEGKSRDEQKAICKVAQEFGTALFKELSSRFSVDLQIRVVLHVDRVEFSDTDHAADLSGGPLMDSERWSPSTETHGFHITPAVVAMLT
jgi:serine/threonine protein kinase